MIERVRTLLVRQSSSAHLICFDTGEAPVKSEPPARRALALEAAAAGE